MEPQTKPRKRKRPDGDGSIRYSDSKALWIGRLMVGLRLDGKPDIREVSAKTQRLCKERLDALKLQAANGTLPSGETAGITMAMFLDRWLATVQPNLRDSTYRLYRGYVETHFKPALGTKRLTKLSHDDVQVFLNAKRQEKRKRGKTEKTLAPRTLHHLYVVLGTALTWGIMKGYLTISPMARVDAPRVKAAEIVPLTPEQTTKLLDVAQAESDPLLALWTVSAYTGARKGELLGLIWDDINLDTGTLHIRRSLKRTSKRTPDYDDPKTARSRRVLDLDADAVDALKLHRDRQTFDRQAASEAYAKLGIVFASEVGTPLDFGNVTRRFKRALRRAGLPVSTRMHDLRHGAATMMLEAGESVPTVSEYLGHASPAVTMAVYAHTVPGSKRRAAERLGSILRDARTATKVTSEESSEAG